jgi:hypothetical protein
MTQQLSKTQVTEPPRDPNYFQQCINDFYDFKERNLRREINFMSNTIQKYKIRGDDLKIAFVYKTGLENVKKLISENRDDLAFNVFFRTFPTCLPSRSRPMIL